MIDLRRPDAETNLLRRGYTFPAALRPLLEARGALTVQVQELQARINVQRGTLEDKQLRKDLEGKIAATEAELLPLLHMIPNVLHETVPDGRTAEDNALVREVFAEKKRTQKQDYLAIGAPLGLHPEIGVDLAHTRFAVMRGDAAKLQRKLLNLALDFYARLGYEEFYVPDMVNQDVMFGTGQYPKFKEELFATEGNQPLFLIPTGEVPLTNVVRNTVLPEAVAEKKMMTHTPCFRKEVGAYGKDTKGIIRQHQFEKVELVRTCLPENGLQTLEEMVAHVDAFMHQLGLPYRIIELCAGDIGFAGHKAYDFEIWFPAEGKYREIATITWCHDFQARRMKAKVKRADGKKELLHTLNGTGLAVGRVLAALLENCYDGKNLVLPACLT